ncbi:MAG: hypothetical protein ACLSHC_14820 [Bilophila wadsworthia]
MHTDRFTPLDAATLLRWMQHDLPNKQLFGIDRELFFMPKPDDPFRMERYGRCWKPLSAWPWSHTQCPNICRVAVRARYIELKTVQVLDERTSPSPASTWPRGYNCEWSQELKRSSFGTSRLSCCCMCCATCSTCPWRPNPARGPASSST